VFERVTIETNMLFRALAIFGVVAHHADFIAFPGGAAFLLALAGYNYQRFKLKSFVRENSPWPSTARYEIRLVRPYLIVVCLFFAWKGVFQWDTLLMVSVLLGNESVTIFRLWFIQALVQATLLIAVIFSIPSVRRAAQQKGWLVALMLFAASTTLTLINRAYPDLPLIGGELTLGRWLSVVFLGWLAGEAQSRWQKAIFIAITLAYCTYFFELTSTTYWIAVGFSATVLLESFPGPQAFAALVNNVARSSYYTYLSHLAVFYVVELGLRSDSPAVWTCIAMFVGWLAWYVVEKRGVPFLAINTLRSIWSRKASARTLPER